MYEKYPDKICPYCKESDSVVKVTYAGCENEIYIECEKCWTVIGEIAR
jgi:hypothetical protein